MGVAHQTEEIRDETTLETCQDRTAADGMNQRIIFAAGTSNIIDLHPPYHLDGTNCHKSRLMLQLFLMAHFSLHKKPHRIE